MHLKALQTLLPPRPRRGNSYFVKFMARQERGVVKRAACCRAAVKITKITQGEEREGIYSAVLRRLSRLHICSLSLNYDPFFSLSFSLLSSLDTRSYLFPTPFCVFVFVNDFTLSCLSSSPLFTCLVFEIGGIKGWLAHTFTRFYVKSNLAVCQLVSKTVLCSCSCGCSGSTQGPAWIPLDPWGLLSCAMNGEITGWVLVTKMPSLAEGYSFSFRQ